MPGSHLSAWMRERKKGKKKPDIMQKETEDQESLLPPSPLAALTSVSTLSPRPSNSLSYPSSNQITSEVGNSFITEFRKVIIDIVE